MDKVSHLEGLHSRMDRKISIIVILTGEDQVLRVVVPISSIESNLRIAINVRQRIHLIQNLHAYSIFVAELVSFVAIPAIGRLVVVPRDVDDKWMHKMFVSTVRAKIK